MKGFENTRQMVQALANNYGVTLSWIWSAKGLDGVKVNGVMVPMSASFWDQVIDTIQDQGK